MLYQRVDSALVAEYADKSPTARVRERGEQNHAAALHMTGNSCCTKKSAALTLTAK